MDPSSPQQQQHLKSLPHYKVVSLLRRYCDDKALIEGRRLHSSITQRGFDRDTFLGNLLVKMYGNCESIEEAKNAFDRIQEPNVYSWTIMLAAYAQNGHLLQARNVFDSMPQKNVVSWTSMVTAYAHNGMLQEARSLFEKMPVRTVVSWNAMLSGYAQSGECNTALHIYFWMLQEGENPNESTFVSVADASGSIRSLQAGRAVQQCILESGYIPSFTKVANALITMLGSIGKWQDSRDIFEQMEYRDEVSWTAMVVAYAKCGHLQEARDTFNDMPGKNLISWSAMIAAYADLGHYTQALNMFRQMDIEGVSPDGVTLVTMFDVCGNLPALREGKLLYEEIQGTKLERDVTVRTSLVGMFTKCGEWGTAKELFDGMPKKDTVMWSSMISSYTRNGFWVLALETFSSMCLDGVKPNEITFVSVLASCSHAGFLEKGWTNFVSMVEDFNLVPDSRHYVCMVDLLARAGEMDEAVELIKHMPFQPDGPSWRAILGSASLEQSLAMDSGLGMDSLHGATYSLLSNAITRGYVL